MKIKLLFSSHCRTAHQSMLGMALLAALSAGAQNFVRNPDFEEPLGPDNWTIVYAPVVNSTEGAGANGSVGGPYDFLVAGRTTMAHKDLVPGTWDGGSSANFLTNYWSKFGLNFAPNHTWVMHAYAKQVVTNLQVGQQYFVSAWIGQNSAQCAHTDAAEVYMEVLQGLGMNQSKRTAFVTDCYQNNPAGWKMYVISNCVASTNGQIEIQLHYNKNDRVGIAGGDANNYWEYRNQNASFDHVAVMRQGQAPYRPPFRVTSFVRTNQEVQLQWQTVRNHRYRIQMAQDLSNPNWAMLEREMNVETNFFATGTNFVFRTNVASLFSYPPYPAAKVPNYADPNAPLFFRIYAEPFEP